MHTLVWIFGIFFATQFISRLYRSIHTKLYPSPDKYAPIEVIGAPEDPVNDNET